MFMGFATDRLIVSFGHGMLSAIAVLGLHRSGYKSIGGYLAAVGLHALLNLGPILSALKLIPAMVASAASYAVILGAFAIVQHQARQTEKTSLATSGEITYLSRG